MKTEVAITAVAVCAMVVTGGTPARADDLTNLRVFYFGNSLTGNTMPRWHGELGQSGGKQWIAEARLGAGWQLWQHREELSVGHRPKVGQAIFSASSSGDLTIDPEILKSAPTLIKRFYQQKWDAIVLQAFAPHLKHVTTEMWGKVKFDQPKDTGDIQSATDIINLYRKLNPRGRAFLYVVWPCMEAGEPRNGLRGAEFPKRDEFDYERQWLKPYVPTDKPWIGHVHRTQEFNYQLFEGLKRNLPELWKEGRLRMIPTGDVFLELNKKMHAGLVPGIPDIKDFYTDVQHVRCGLPRYTAAAVFYACLFEEHPGKLDWRLYNDRAKYGPDPHHDAGELLEITAERARIVGDTIWEVLTDHPYTGLKN